MPSGSPDDLIYGRYRAAPGAHFAIDVFDGRDRALGVVVFHARRRVAWLVMTAGEERFVADVLPALRPKVQLRVADGDRLVSTFERGRLGAYRFRSAGVGTLEGRAPLNGLRMHPSYLYTMAKRPVGLGQGIGSWRADGVLVVLPTSIPLPVRMFALAMQLQAG